MTRTLIAITLALAAMPAQAKVYKWVDGNGMVQYTETAPAGASSTEIAAGPSAASAPAALPDPMMMQMEDEARAKRKRREAEVEAQALRDTEHRKNLCAQALNDLDILQRQTAVYSLNENGERVYMDDETRATIIDQARKSAAANCQRH